MFINPKDCLHYQVCKFADDAGCLEGCDFRIEKSTSYNSEDIDEDNSNVLHPL